jgi:hypothetical protein
MGRCITLGIISSDHHRYNLRSNKMREKKGGPDCYLHNSAHQIWLDRYSVTLSFTQ